MTVEVCAHLGPVGESEKVLAFHVLHRDSGERAGPLAAWRAEQAFTNENFHGPCRASKQALCRVQFHIAFKKMLPCQDSLY